MNAICCSLNLDFFVGKFPRPAPAKPNREFLTKNGPIRRPQGAEALGLHDEVAPDAFTAMLGGTLPDGTLLGTTRGGVREHKPGWDLTLSAPKSVSVLALVASDRRLLDAQDRAASITFDYAERHAAVRSARSRQPRPPRPCSATRSAPST